MFWLPPEEAALRFGVSVDELVTATKRGELQVRAKVAGGELVATLCSTDLIERYGAPVRGKLAAPVAPADKAELESLRAELANREEHIGHVELKNARLAGRLEAADRVHQTAGLYKAGKFKRVIVAGGNQPWSKVEQSEARAIRLLLLDWGVQATAIVLETESRNTRENAVNAWHLLEETKCVRPLLITSAFHMQRSVKSFAKLGIEVFPVSTDIRVIHSSKYTVFDFIPNANALKMTTDAIREWIGQLTYQWRGWN